MDQKFKNPYKNKYIVLIKNPIQIITDLCSIYQETIELDCKKCGLYTIDIQKDDIYNTLYITYIPVNINKYKFKEIKYQLYEYNKSPTTSLVDMDPNKVFDYNEIFKAQGFVDFINECLQIKEIVELEPSKFYFIYKNIKFVYQDNKWYKNNEEILEHDLLVFFYHIPWEYDNYEVKLKKYNIFKRLINYGRKQNYKKESCRKLQECINEA